MGEEQPPVMKPGVGGEGEGEDEPPAMKPGAEKVKVKV